MDKVADIIVSELDNDLILTVFSNVSAVEISKSLWREPHIENFFFLNLIFFQTKLKNFKLHYCTLQALSCDIFTILYLLMNSISSRAELGKLWNCWLKA